MLVGELGFFGLDERERGYFKMIKMELRLLLLVLGVTRAMVPLGSLGGYLNLTEMRDTIENLTLYYNKISVEDDKTFFNQIHFSNNTGFPEKLRKVKVLVLGGFYAGTPISAFQVLYLAEKIAYMAFSGDKSLRSLIYSHEFYFIPVLNYPGYQYMENNTETGGFVKVKTGLEGNDLNCSGYDIGINPYFNFPEYFESKDPSCSDENPGSESLESEISKNLFTEYFEGQELDIIINFQGDSKSYILPPGNKLNEMTEKELFFYQGLKIPEGYRLDTRVNLTGQDAKGSFLDFSSSSSSSLKDSVSVEISMDTDISETKDIYTKCEANYEPFIDLILGHFPRPEFGNFTWELYRCDSHNTTICHYTEYVVFELGGTNSGYSDYRFVLNFDPGFEEISEFTAVNLSSRLNRNTAWKNLPFETYPTSQILKTNDTIPGFSNYSIMIVYGKSSEGNFGAFHCLGNFVSQDFYVNDVLIDEEYKESKGKKGGHGRSGIVIGWILMGVILLVVGIAAGVLRFMRTGEAFKNLTKEVAKGPNAI